MTVASGRHVHSNEEIRLAVDRLPGKESPAFFMQHQRDLPQESAKEVLASSLEIGRLEKRTPNEHGASL